ncbi:Gfo/Idh/MocA family oxidoreductase [Streptomyces bambusae]|uniref:Gfo/Idh/MocA family protein n=1 Tax=Streptomyces bambusae TaxID=1550616 RepID=UPI001CFCBB78|nr:Gfo/Idh/MocA family oxidoreductase [Streptomyces bambusae]MCB5164477.1 Gfo/Idh/MocA family oxidoreductase [Streptomyces bambusae]
MTPPVKAVPELRLGFIGHGRHARANLYPSLALAGARLACIATRDEQAARAAANAHGAGSGYGDHRQMLAQEALDAVFVSVAPEDQAGIAEDCLKAGAHVFVEKPLGLDEADARRVAATAQRYGRQVMVGFMKRHAPAYRKLAEVIADSRNFGRVLSFNGFFAFSPWTDTLRDDTYLKFGAVHIIDLVRHLFGEVTEATGFRNSRDADISMALALRFDSGAVGNLTLAAAPSWSREQEELTVTGQHGFVRTENLTTVAHHHARPSGPAEPWQGLHEDTVVLKSANSPASGGHQDLYLRGFAGEVAHFLDAVRHGEAPVGSAADNVATMALCDTILRLPHH